MSGFLANTEQKASHKLQDALEAPRFPFTDHNALYSSTTRLISARHSLKAADLYSKSLLQKHSTKPPQKEFQTCGQHA